MQSVSTEFTTRTDAQIRPLLWKVLISWDKAYDAGVDFFTVGSSTIGGTDIIKGSGSVVQEWDRYVYEDYSDRVLSVEINRETEPPTSPITLATATIVLDNHDDIFTPGNGSSPLDGFLISRRPVRINLGFGTESVAKFVGITTTKPVVDERSKTVKLQCIDFLNAIMNVPLDEEVMYINARTDEIIQGLLELGGLNASQFDLDYGTVIIPFAYFKKGSKIGDGIKDVAEAELGNVSMLENGTPRFFNRHNWADNASVWNFDKDNVIEKKALGESSVINVVEVFSKAREVQAKQKIWEANGEIEMAPNTTTEVFIDFKDEYGDLPVPSADDPDYVSVATTSLYATNDRRDSTGATYEADISLTSSTLFSTGMKLVFTSTADVPVFLTRLEIHGTPAKVAQDIYVRVTDTASIGTKDGYEERPVKIDNDLIQDETAANSIGGIIIADRAQDDDQQELIVKSVPQLQIGDMITYDDENVVGETYFVTRINDIVNNSGYRQLLRVSKRTINKYFAVAISSLGGTDKIAP